MPENKKLSEMTLAELWQLFPIVLREYNPQYPCWFDDEKELLTGALDGAAQRIRHIGSTAVPGLLAKPTVDILLEISTDAVLPAVRASLQGCGYVVMASVPPPDFRLDLCKGYTESGWAERVFHLHVRYPGDWDEVFFCAYLRRHPEVAVQYRELKLALARRFQHHRDNYTAGKTAFVQKYTARARQEFPAGPQD